jgi:hypothetical protein
MINVKYPEPEFRMKSEGENTFIFDTLRKTWLLLTEEEWVRQNFVQYLIQIAHYPSSYIALEKEITLNELKKRFDILIYNKEFQPWMLIECKARDVQLSEDVLQQVLRYNISVPVEYIIITNGNSTIGWKKEGGGLQIIEELPLFN